MQNKDLITNIEKDLYGIENIANEILQYTNDSPDEVWKNIAMEMAETGYNMKREIAKYEVTPFVFNEKMIDLYMKSNGFIYESIIESRNRIYKWRFIINILLNLHPDFENRKKIKILLFGDSVGSDSIYLKQLGFDVYYHDFDSYCASFASIRFNRRNLQINKLKPTDTQKFNHVICLEVAEHANNPVELIENVCKYAKKDTLIFFSEAFKLIHENYPTHLLENLKYAGKTRELFKRNGMVLVCKDIDEKPFIFSFSRTFMFKPYFIQQNLKRKVKLFLKAIRLN